MLWKRVWVEKSVCVEIEYEGEGWEGERAMEKTEDEGEERIWIEDFGYEGDRAREKKERLWTIIEEDEEEAE